MILLSILSVFLGIAAITGLTYSNIHLIKLLEKKMILEKADTPLEAEQIRMALEDKKEEEILDKFREKAEVELPLGWQP